MAQDNMIKAIDLVKKEPEKWGELTEEQLEEIESSLLTKYSNSYEVITEKEETCCDKFKILYEVLRMAMFLLWDKIGFFGTALYKLDRLKGIKPDWLTKYKDTIGMIQATIMFGGVIYIFYTSINTIGSMSLEKLDSQGIGNIEFNVSETAQMFASLQM